VPGPHRLAFFVRFHAADAPGFAARALRDAIPALALPGRASPDAPLADGSRLVELDDPDVQLTAIEPREDGSLRLRLLNAVPKARTVGLRLPAGLLCAGLVDLADRPDAATALRREGTTLALDLRPWQLATLRLHAEGA
jgi:alpha-mannosidase